MKLESLQASGYRSLRKVDLTLGQLNVLIGANASGKSNILDALRFLSWGLAHKDFRGAVHDRGGPLSLSWKGEAATAVELEATFTDQDDTYVWNVKVSPSGGWEFDLDESIRRYRGGQGPPDQLLQANNGRGWWWSKQVGGIRGPKKGEVQLNQQKTGCALAAAAADENFPAREVAQFVAGWAFFDPSPSVLRRIEDVRDSTRLDPLGWNLAARLREIQETSEDRFEEILTAMKHVLGIPTSIQFRESEDGRVSFVQEEAGLRYPVHQLGASSGTLRMLALMTALIGESETTLVGIEEPENYVHPSAVGAFAEYLRQASERLQVMVTTHSPILLDHIEDPGSICVVKLGDEGTDVIREDNPQAVAEALKESGFGLGEFYRTKGFGT